MFNIKFSKLIIIFLFSIPHLVAQSSADIQKQYSLLTDQQKKAIAIQQGINVNNLNQTESPQTSDQQDARYLRDQSPTNKVQQNMPGSYLNRYYRDNQILDPLLGQDDCYDQDGNLIIIEFEDQEKINNKDQNQCYDRLGNLIDAPEIIESEELTRFGLSLFNTKISTFSAFENMPVPDNYILGSGDEISVKLVGAENTLLDLTIQRNGTVFIPKIGEIILSGFDFKAATNIIQSRIEQELIGVNAFITMGRTKSINIFMSGEVKSPGMYSISALSTITQSLYQAGGISEIGSLRNIKVLRNGEEISVFDVYDLLIYGDSKNDIRLRSGDVVFIPPHEGLIEVTGAVKRSHIFEVKAGDTFDDLLKWTGGFNANAYPLASTLTRSNSVGMIASVLNLNLLSSDNLRKKLLANDSINIPETGKDQRAFVSVQGAFNRPGRFGWTEGMKVSDIFSNQGDYLIDFSNETDFDVGIIERFNQQTKIYSVLYFSPIDILNDTNSKSNIRLNEFDVLYFLPRNTIDRFVLLETFIQKLSTNNINGQKLKIFSINGDVKFPGSYPLPSNITLKDALKIAGGTTDTSFLNSVEISRAFYNEKGIVESRVFEISALNSLNEASNFEILPRDRIMVRMDQDLTSEKIFTLKGFVRFPGEYPLNSGETLSSAIKRAGGLKDNAFEKGARLIRGSLIESQTMQNKDLAASIRTSYASSLLTSEDNRSTIQDIELVAQIIEEIEGEGRVVINLEEALSNSGSKFNITLEDGDALIVPQFTNIINIIGEVRNPNVVNYISSLDADDYLNLAGGLTQRADSASIYIIRANGSIISLKKSFFSLGLSKPQFQPGDTLVVPIKQNYQNPLPLWSQVTQIIYQSIVSLAAVKGL